MARDTLTGSRIRERRISQGMRQADLARSAGISASYLNLIEHNRRRIGGKLLLEIAQALGVDSAALSEGAGAALIAGLREAASDVPQAGAEVDRVDEFAGRFPGWAAAMLAMRDRVTQLERSVQVLTDRMTHDPQLAASLHEMLSTVTAIRSAASILAEPGEIDAEWQARFHRNIYEDSARLTETSRGLVTYLEADNAEATETGTPQEELDGVLERAGHHIPELERGSPVEEAATRLGSGISRAAQVLLRDWLQRYAEDAEALPIEELQPHLAQAGPDPLDLSQALGEAPVRVMRRLAAMPPEVLPDPVGLAICDASGVLIYRKPLPDFPMPRFGAACPLWPLYAALSRPYALLATELQALDRAGATLRVEAQATPAGPLVANSDPLFRSHMLVRRAPSGAADPLRVGVTCRLCPKPDCPARREPSILSTS
ncbi:helix-turn-helix domain-containing protein [Sagittula sp. SSi028]|uniref:helix-turn-helix domain-containing protein n=1 Tax=Sagittula sp. SSi028 TaxID=3400636 RepID=UPI003AF98329